VDARSPSSSFQILTSYSQTIFRFFLSLLLKPILPLLTSPPTRARNQSRPHTAQTSRGERGSNARIHSSPSSHQSSLPPTPSAAPRQPALKRRPQPGWVIHKSVSSSGSSTSSQETKHRRSSSTARSCASAPATPLKSSILLDFSDGEDYFPRPAAPSSPQPSSTPHHPPTHTDNEAEPSKGRRRNVKDHSSRRILFNNGLRNPSSNTVPPPVMTLYLPRYLPDVESTDTERTTTVFTAEPEEMQIPDDPLTSMAPQVRKPPSWKSRLLAKSRVATPFDADVSLTAVPTPVSPAPSSTSTKERETGFLRMFGTNKRPATSATVVMSAPGQSTAAAATNDNEPVDTKKKNTFKRLGKKASRKDAPDDPSPKCTKSPLLPRRACTQSEPHLPPTPPTPPTPPSPFTSPFTSKPSLKHAATMGHCPKSPSSPSYHTDAPSTPQTPTPSKQQQQQHPKEAKNAPGHCGMHSLRHPIQACQAHLYNVHGIGSGPATLDLLTPTPVPKGGVRRTDPYAELGAARVPAAAAAVNVKAARRASAPSIAAGADGA
jgi:hypothetical protein